MGAAPQAAEAGIPDRYHQRRARENIGRCHRGFQARRRCYGIRASHGSGRHPGPSERTFRGSAGRHNRRSKAPPIPRSLYPGDLADKLPPALAIPHKRESAGPINEDCQRFIVGGRALCGSRRGLRPKRHFVKQRSRCTVGRFPARSILPTDAFDMDEPESVAARIFHVERKGRTASCVAWLGDCRRRRDLRRFRKTSDLSFARDITGGVADKECLLSLRRSVHFAWDTRHTSMNVNVARIGVRRRWHFHDSKA